jgi:hypothetical protein
MGNRPVLARTVLSAALVLALAGCGDDDGLGGSGASSPEAAVERFLAPFASPPRGDGPTADAEVQEWWASACDGVDPSIRRAMRFEPGERGDLRVNCGAGVVLTVMYTGDTGDMDPPSKVSGSPVSADTSASESVVTVDMHYESRPRPTGEPSDTAPPANASIKVLVIKRDGAWWVATPQAFNPLAAAEGGVSEAELRRQHSELLSGGDE